MSGPWEQFQPTASQGQPAQAGPWSRFAKQEQTPALPPIDFNRPVADVRADIAKLPDSQRPIALKAWAKDYVGRERKANADAGGMEDVGAGIDNVARTVANGVPVVAPLAQKAESAVKAGLYGITGGAVGAPYDESQAYQNAKQDAIDAGATVRGHIPQAVPFVGGEPISDATILKLLGGGAAIGATGTTAVGERALAKLFPDIVGGSMLKAMGKNALASTAVGTADAAARSDSLSEARVNAVNSVGPSATFGALMVPAARGVGNAVSKTSALVRPLPAELQEYSRPAVETVSKMANFDRLPEIADDQARDLGEHAMLADYGDNLRTTLEALASKTGEHMTEGMDALKARDAGRLGRLERGFDDTLGPNVNVPQSQAMMRDDAIKAAAPHYADFYNTPIPMTPELSKIMDAIPDRVQKAAAEQMKIARVPDAPDGQVHPMKLDLMKQSLDDDVRALSRAGYTGASGRVIGLKNSLLKETDRILSQGNWGGTSSWAKGRALWSSDASAADALQSGIDAIKNKVHPDQMHADMTDLESQHQRDLYSLGARSQFRNIAGEAATKSGPNGDTKLLQSLMSEFGRDRVGLLAEGLRQRPQPSQPPASQPPASPQAPQPPVHGVWSKPQPPQPPQPPASPKLSGGYYVERPATIQHEAQGPSSQVFKDTGFVNVPRQTTRPRATNLVNLAKAESRMAETSQVVRGNSATARRLEAQKLFPDTNATPSHLNITLEGMAFGPAKKVIDALLAEPLNEKSIRKATDATKMLVAQGGRRQEIVKGLLEYGKRQATTPQQRSAVTRIANQVLHASRVNVANGRQQ